MNAEDEIQSAVLALKSRDLDTKEIYREVCSLLFFRFGVTPTVTQLYRLVQKGSMSVPTAVLAKFWVEVRERSKIDLAHPDLPPELAGIAGAAIGALWKKATESAHAELEVFRDLSRGEVAAAQLRAAEFETKVKEATTAKEGIEALREKAERLKDALAVELEAERRMHAVSIARGQELQSHFDDAKLELERTRERFSADLVIAKESAEAAAARSDAAERRALLEIDHERQARAKAEKSLAEMRVAVSAAETRSRDLDVAHAADSATLQAEIFALQGALRAAQTAAAERIEEIAALQASSDHQKTRIIELTSESATLRSVLDQSRLPPAPSKRASRATKGT